DLRDVRPADLRRRLAALFQDFTRYDFSAAENLRLGDATIPREDDPRIEAAAERAGAGPLIRGFPQGFATVLGRRFRGRHEPSAGQWQRLALARAFVRDADLALLDEPSSALDPAAEAEIIDRLRELLDGRMALLASHRFALARLADRILVLDRG